MKLPIGIKVSSRYGYRVHPITKVESFHNGIDIVMPIGTTIFAPCNGVVDRIWSDSIGGLQLRFTGYDESISKDTYTFGFAHLSRVVALEGVRYNEGDIIAYSGNSGRSNGPHLHLTLRINGKLTDPLYLYNLLKIKL